MKTWFGYILYPFSKRLSSLLVLRAQEITSISLYKFGSWFGSSTVLTIIEILTISSLVEKQSWWKLSLSSISAIIHKECAEQVFANAPLSGMGYKMKPNFKVEMIDKNIKWDLLLRSTLLWYHPLFNCFGLSKSCFLNIIKSSFY